VIKSDHSRTLERLVATRRQQIIEAMITGGNVSDVFIGQVRGLDEAVVLSEQADRILNGEDNDGA
jgi:hypothetical protein